MFLLTVLFDHQSLLVHISASLSCLYNQSNFIRSPHKKSKLETLKPNSVSSKAIRRAGSFDRLIVWWNKVSTVLEGEVALGGRDKWLGKEKGFRGKRALIWSTNQDLHLNNSSTNPKRHYLPRQRKPHPLLQRNKLLPEHYFPKTSQM